MNRKKLPAAEGGGGGDAEGNGGDSPGKGSLGASEKLVSGKSSKKGKTGKGVGSEVVEAPSEEGIPVIVKRGESLSSYTKWGGFTMEELERLNPGIGSRMLREGDTVRIPLTAEQFDQFQEKRAKGKRGKLTITPPGDVPPKEPASAP